MIRVIIYIALITLIALAGAWIADRPGEVAVTWQGWRIETSVIVAVVLLLAVMVVLMLAWSLVRAIWRSPDLVGRFVDRRRAARGERAISQGLIAVGAGDLRAARKFAAEARRFKPREPLALLLSAQTAQLAGDRAAAELAFRTMAEREDTKLLGLRGLFIEAQRRADLPAARDYAEEAARTAPALAWAGQAALEFRCGSGDWEGALAVLERNMQNKLLDRPTYRRQRAVLLTVAALAAEENDRDRARALALEAVKLAPTLVPAAELAARLLLEKRQQRRAARIIERAWQANPHPDLAQVYAYLRPADSPRDRLARVQALAARTPGHIEGAIAVARAAIDAQEFALARNALKPWLDDPTQRVAELMAELETAESGNEGRAREWMTRALRARRDPAWIADGFVSDRWLPISPVTGKLDAMQWKAPLAALGGAAVIEPQSETAAAPSSAQATPVEVPNGEPAPDKVERPPSSDRAEPKVEPVIPLIHAPDDPGPEPPPDREPAPEPAADRLWRIRLFR
jgi:HemY protein